jgi:predicted esterase
MALFTKGHFQDLAQNYSGVRGLRGLVNEQRAFSKSTSTTSIFLSHAHNDKAIVEQAKLFFEHLGISVYIDWADQTMPESPNGTTASKIKSQIFSNDKFYSHSMISYKYCSASSPQ